MKFLTVNMEELTTRFLPVSSEYDFLGGRALIGKILASMVPPKANPYGPQSKLIVAPGLLAGTRVPCSGRLSVGGLSPLTGGIKEANSGGTAGHSLARLGIKAVIIEGKPAAGCYVLKIDSKGAELIREDSLAGLKNYETSRRLREAYGEKISLIMAGPAGERKYANSTVAVTDPSGTPSRHAARGGLGGVMAAKGIKAIVIDDKEPTYIKKVPPEFNEECKEWSKELIQTRKVLSLYGTANLVDVVNELGGLATRNFSSGRFEAADKINAEKLVSLIKARGGNPTHACQYGCPIRCSNVFHDPQGRHLTSSLEFETITLVGANLGIGDLDVIAQIDRFCDDFGLDTIELGCAIGVAMEAGLLKFGDVDGVFNLLDEITRDTLLGRLLCQGATTTGKVLGVTRVPAVKGQSLSAYDPRAMKGTGVTYATSPMGADHTAGNCLPGRVGYRPETQKALDPREPEGQLALSRDLQYMHAVCDSMGICMFVGASLDTMNNLSRLLSLYFNKPVTAEEVIELGKKTVLSEVSYNKKCGFTKYDNDLPEFMRNEPLDGLTFNIEQHELHGFFEE